MNQATQTALWLAAFLVALGVIGRAVQWLWVTLSKVARLADGLLGEPSGPDGKPGRPGVLERMAAIEELMRAQDDRLRCLEAQMRPNGGNSLRDTIDRIAAHSPELVT